MELITTEHFTPENPVPIIQKASHKRNKKALRSSQKRREKAIEMSLHADTTLGLTINARPL
jgi:hypothetical protein